MTTRTPTARAATRTRIWPGPECLRERPSRSVMRPTRGSYYPAAVLRLVDGGVWIDGCVYDSRHVMPGVTIALAWKAVRARREPGTRVVLHEFFDAGGLRFVDSMREDVGSVATILPSEFNDECSVMVSVADGSWWWPASKMAALPFNASEVGRG
jgi:hypothetical protein